MSALRRLQTLLWADVETKVKAAGFAALASSAVVSVLTALLGHDVSPAVVGIVDTVVPSACTWFAGWLAKHTPRTNVS